MTSIGSFDQMRQAKELFGVFEKMLTECAEDLEESRAPEDLVSII